MVMLMLQLQMIPYYEKLGYAVEGDLFDEDGGEYGVCHVRGRTD